MSVLLGGMGGQTSVERPGGRETDYTLPKRNAWDRFGRRVSVAAFWIVLVPVLAGQYFAAAAATYAAAVLVYREHPEDGEDLEAPTDDEIRAARIEALLRDAVVVAVAVLATMAVGRGAVDWLWYPVRWYWSDGLMPVLIGSRIVTISARALGIGSGLVLVGASIWLAFKRDFDKAASYGVGLAALWLTAGSWVLRGAFGETITFEPVLLALPRWVVLIRAGVPFSIAWAWVQTMPDYDWRQRLELLMPGASGVVYGRASVRSIPMPDGVELIPEEFDKAEKNQAPKIRYTQKKSMRMPGISAYTVLADRDVGDGTNEREPTIAASPAGRGHHADAGWLPLAELYSDESETPEAALYRLIAVARTVYDDDEKYSGRYWTRQRPRGTGRMTQTQWDAFNDWMTARGFAARENDTNYIITTSGRRFLRTVIENEARAWEIVEAWEG